MSGTNKKWPKRTKPAHQKLKLLICLFVSNLLVYLISTSNNSGATIPALQKVDKNDILVQLPLEIYVPLEAGKPQSISIYGPNKKKIISKAYLHKKINAENRDDQKPPLYQVELTQNDLNRIIKYNSSYFIAYPINHHNERNYEITF